MQVLDECKVAIDRLDLMILLVTVGAVAIATIIAIVWFANVLLVRQSEPNQ